MKSIPPGALWLGLAGVIPFVWAAISNFLPADFLFPPEGFPHFMGKPVLLNYGLIILCFMSGTLWGFGTRAPNDQMWKYLCLSVLPALWGFFMIANISIVARVDYLLIGFIALLGLDYIFFHANLAPSWWMALRSLLTTIVVICILTVRISHD